MRTEDCPLTSTHSLCNTCTMAFMYMHSHTKIICTHTRFFRTKLKMYVFIYLLSKYNCTNLCPTEKWNDSKFISTLCYLRPTFSIVFLEIWGNKCKRVQFLTSKTALTTTTNNSQCLLSTYNASYCAKHFIGITSLTMPNKYYRWPLFLSFCTEVLQSPH